MRNNEAANDIEWANSIEWANEPVFVWSARMSTGQRTWSEMREGARRLHELWLEHLMVEQVKALKEIWKATR